MKKIIGSIFLLIIVTLCTIAFLGKPSQTEKVLFVSPKGSDSNPGTKIKPLKTINKAANKAKKGVTVRIRKGIYPENVLVKHSGTKAKPIIFEAYQNEKVVITGKKNSDQENLFLIKNKNYIYLTGIEFTNFWTTKKNVTPVAVMLQGKSTGIHIENNHIHDLGTKHNDGNAHGIAVYGSGAITDILIAKNKITDLKLGNSEALVVNGNVKNFKIKENVLKKNNNIGIDVIGHENVAKDKKHDFARNGSIIGNKIDQSSSKKNPAYKGEQSAGGIYVDGGRMIKISNNTTTNNDIGIEIASEHHQKQAKNITVINNKIANNAYTGIAVGGYERSVGGIQDVTIRNNTLKENDLTGDETGQLLIQSNIKDLKISNNRFYPSKSYYYMVRETKQAASITLQNNRYYKGTKAPSYWLWKGKELTTFSAFKKASNETGQLIKK